MRRQCYDVPIRGLHIPFGRSYELRLDRVNRQHVALRYGGTECNVEGLGHDASSIKVGSGACLNQRGAPTVFWAEGRCWDRVAHSQVAVLATQTVAVGRVPDWSQCRGAIGLELAIVMKGAYPYNIER